MDRIDRQPLPVTVTNSPAPLNRLREVCIPVEDLEHVSSLLRQKLELWLQPREHVPPELRADQIMHWGETREKR
jgi:hypothetical protein